MTRELGFNQMNEIFNLYGFQVQKKNNIDYIFDKFQKFAVELFKKDLAKRKTSLNLMFSDLKLFKKIANKYFDGPLDNSFNNEIIGQFDLSLVSEYIEFKDSLINIDVFKDAFFLNHILKTNYQYSESDDPLLNVIHNMVYEVLKNDRYFSKITGEFRKNQYTRKLISINKFMNEYVVEQVFIKINEDIINTIKRNIVYLTDDYDSRYEGLFNDDLDYYRSDNYLDRFNAIDFNKYIDADDSLVNRINLFKNKDDIELKIKDFFGYTKEAK